MKNLWCDVNLNTIADNIAIIRKNSDKKLFAVIKCNAYGLGINRISEFLDDKADGFAVNNIEEALQVRSEKPVLILMPNVAAEELQKAKSNFIFTLDENNMKYFSRGCYKVHIMVNTGMNRFGVKPGRLGEFISNIRNNYPDITIDGIYTHFNNPGSRRQTLKQINIFRNIVQLYGAGIPNVHCLSSRGFLKYNFTDFDNWLRIGSIIYGYGGSDEGFRLVYGYKATPVYISEIGKNESVGYGCKYKAKKRTKIGIFEVGSMQGFNCRLNMKYGLIFSILMAVYRCIKKESLIFWKGRGLKILGNSCMSYTTVDLGGINFDSNMIFDVKISSVVGDSSIEKRYRLG